MNTTTFTPYRIYPPYRTPIPILNPHTVIPTHIPPTPPTMPTSRRLPQGRTPASTPDISHSRSRSILRLIYISILHMLVCRPRTSSRRLLRTISSATTIISKRTIHRDMRQTSTTIAMYMIMRMKDTATTCAVYSCTLWRQVLGSSLSCGSMLTVYTTGHPWLSWCHCLHSPNPVVWLDGFRPDRLLVHRGPDCG